jgi:hypothetical protein
VRILDEDNDKSLSAIILYLTKSEASQLRDYLEQVLAHPIGRHEHVSNSDYTKEVTICIYDPDHLDENFHERSKKLILEDR